MSNDVSNQLGKNMGHELIGYAHLDGKPLESKPKTPK